MKLTNEDIQYIKEKAVSIIKETINNSNTKMVNEGKKSQRKKAKKSEDAFDGTKASVDGFDDKSLNLAQYAYRLYPDMDKASARSKFYKKLKHKKVTDGYSKKKTYRYNFTPSEATKLSNLSDKTFKEKK